MQSATKGKYMPLQQASDFLAESEALFALLAPLEAAAYERQTQFKSWSFNDILVHLHFWNQAVDLSAQDPEQFGALLAQLGGALAAGTLRSFENGAVSARGPALSRLWIEHVRQMAPRWQAMDPKQRLAWVGPSMSARS
ncbi:MAG TPA: TIGR03084 family protein, partial [Aliiroseovarius sp.]|nr:TIGR03084 family protein [Aliiroseovarius sp.]